MTQIQEEFDFTRRFIEASLHKPRLPVFVYRPDKQLPLPFNKDPFGNAGWDLYATETIEVVHGDIVKVPVNVCIAIPSGHYGLVTPRSGLSSQGVNIIAGTIDSNYRGQISAIVQFFAKIPWWESLIPKRWKKKRTFVIERGMRIAQLVILEHKVPEWREVNSQEELGETARGTDGFGKSGSF